MGNQISNQNLWFRNRRGRSKETDLLSLPDGLLHSILKDVGDRSLGNLLRAKMICHSLGDIANSPVFLRDLDLLNMRTPLAPLSGVRLFYTRCLEEGNRSALFLRGCSDFFRKNLKEEGLFRIRISAEKGYPLAIYAYAHLSRIMRVGDESRFAPSRDFVRRHRATVARFRSNQRIHPPAYFVEGEDKIDYGHLVNCACCPYTYWEHPYNEGSKLGDMCDSCFWIVQMLWFSRYFPSTVEAWPEENPEEDAPQMYPVGDLHLYQTMEHRKSHWQKFLVVCVLVLVVSCVMQLA